MIAIIDYGAGNIRSIEKALEHVGAQVQVTDDPQVVAGAQAVVLPGVGSGGTAMARMTERGLDDSYPFRRHSRANHFWVSAWVCNCWPIIMLKGEVAALGLFPGEVRRIPHGPKIPHMGWNQVTPLHAEFSPSLPISFHESYFYFAHSYYVEPQDQQGVAASPTMVRPIVV